MAPGRPDVALRLSRLPIAVTASGEAAAIARFYVVMHALAVDVDPTGNIGDELQEIAAKAAKELPVSGYSHDMYEFVRNEFLENHDKNDWEQTRDAVYDRYQIKGAAGYLYQRPFDAGINFAEFD